MQLADPHRRLALPVGVEFYAESYCIQRSPDIRESKPRGIGKSRRFCASLMVPQEIMGGARWIDAAGCIDHVFQYRLSRRKIILQPFPFLESWLLSVVAVDTVEVTEVTQDNQLIIALCRGIGHNSLNSLLVVIGRMCVWDDEGAPHSAALLRQDAHCTAPHLSSQ